MFEIELTGEIAAIGRECKMRFRNGERHRIRMLVLSDGEDWEKGKVGIEFWDGRTQMLDGFAVGEWVTETTSLRSIRKVRGKGEQWNTKCSARSVRMATEVG